MPALRQVCSSIFKLGVFALILGALLLVIPPISGRGISSDALLFLFVGFACSGIAWFMGYLLERTQKQASKQEKTTSAQGMTAKHAASAAVPPGGFRDDQMHESNDKPVVAPEEAMEVMLDKDKIHMVEIGLLPLVWDEQLPLAEELVMKFLKSDSHAEKSSMASTLLTRGGENLLSLLEPEGSPWYGSYGSNLSYYNLTGISGRYRLRDGIPLQQAMNQLLAYSRWVQVHFKEEAPHSDAQYTRRRRGHVHIQVLSDAPTVGCDDAFWELCVEEKIRIVAYSKFGDSFYSYVDNRVYEFVEFAGYKSLDDFGDNGKWGTELVAGAHGRPEWLHANKERNP